MSTYPVRKHTRIASIDFLTHVFGLFDKGASTSIILGLQNKCNSTATLMDFLNIPPDEFQGFDFTSVDVDGNKIVLGLTKAEIRLAKNIQNWINYEAARRADVDMVILTEDDYDAFLLVNAKQMSPGVTMTPPVPQNTTSQYYQVPSTVPRSEERRVGKECRSGWS